MRFCVWYKNSLVCGPMDGCRLSEIHRDLGVPWLFRLWRRQHWWSASTGVLDVVLERHLRSWRPGVTGHRTPGGHDALARPECGRGQGRHGGDESQRPRCRFCHLCQEALLWLRLPCVARIKCSFDPELYKQSAYGCHKPVASVVEFWVFIEFHELCLTPSWCFRLF